jgi:rod shape-determining protein MreB
MLGFRSVDFCFDFGSANIRISSIPKGVLITEASRAVVYHGTGNPDIIALGDTALDMHGKLPKSLEMVYLVRDGVVQESFCLEYLVREMLGQMQENIIWAMQQVYITVPNVANDVEKQNLRELMKKLGINRVHFINRAMAGATTLKIPYQQPHGYCIIDIGAHTTDMTILSCSDIVANKLVKLGGSNLDQALSRYIRENYNIEISSEQARKLKEQYGCAIPDMEQTELVEIRGKSLETLFPEMKYIPRYEIHKGIGNGLQLLVDAIEEFIEHVPLELSTDVAQIGIVLVGGGALLPEIDVAITNVINILAIIPENPHETCVLGASSVGIIESL